VTSDIRNLPAPAERSPSAERHPAPAFLASVTNVAEGRLAVASGADIIDCKDPSRGALGALPLDAIFAVRAAVPREIPVSATVGDLKPEPDVLTLAVEAAAATGVDYVKIGLFAGGSAGAAIARLGRLSIGRTQLVGVLLADQAPDFTLIDAMGAAGFAGVLLDTAHKQSGSLPDLMDASKLREFIGKVHRRGMFSGLAGSLRRDHIPALLQLGTDILGFRGALCEAGARSAKLDSRSLAEIRRAIPLNTKPIAARPVEAAQ